MRSDGVFVGGFTGKYSLQGVQWACLLALSRGGVLIKRRRLCLNLLID